MGTVVLDSAEAAKLGEEGREIAYAHESEDFKEAAYRAVIEAARTHEYFTADQVWEILGTKDVQGSSLGGVFVRCAHEGIMQSTGEFRRSERGATHGRPVSIWRSLR